MSADMGRASCILSTLIDGPGLVHTSPRVTLLLACRSRLFCYLLVFLLFLFFYFFSLFFFFF